MISLSAAATTSSELPLLGGAEWQAVGLLAIGVFLLLNSVADALLKAEIEHLVIKEGLGLVSAVSKLLAAVATFVWVTMAAIQADMRTLAITLVISVLVAAGVVACCSSKRIEKKKKATMKKEADASAAETANLKKAIEEAVRDALKPTV